MRRSEFSNVPNLISNGIFGRGEANTLINDYLNLAQLSVNEMDVASTISAYENFRCTYPLIPHCINISSLQLFIRAFGQLSIAMLKCKMFHYFLRLQDEFERCCKKNCHINFEKIELSNAYYSISECFPQHMLPSGKDISEGPNIYIGLDNLNRAIRLGFQGRNDDQLFELHLSAIFNFQLNNTRENDNELQDPKKKIIREISHYLFETRNHLKSIRKKIHIDLLVASDDLVIFEHISKYSEEIRKIAGKIIELATKLLGNGPIDFSVFLMGSASRDMATPYSDIELGIMLKNDSFRNDRYFRTLFDIIHTMFRAFGEAEDESKGFYHDHNDRAYYDTNYIFFNTQKGFLKEINEYLGRIKLSNNDNECSEYSILTGIIPVFHTNVSNNTWFTEHYKSISNICSDEQKLALICKNHQIRLKNMRKSIQNKLPFDIKRDYLAPITYWLLDVCFKYKINAQSPRKMIENLQSIGCFSRI